ncbi:hypothetical protein ACQP10_38375 (plasmid) [Streptosporangium sandarakinum]|uniref:hypothetical protein n=1 Tax=Streptosporangium sandarakinum TaxID=1260955 RepID=UPI003D8DA039
MATFAERLTEALAARGVSHRKAARDITAAGFRISHGYIGQLARGYADNPNLDVLTALANYLGTTVGWLVGDQEPTGREPVAARVTGAGGQEPDEAEVRQQMEDLGVHHLAERTVGLSELSLSAIAQIIEAARIAEGLDRQGSQTPDDQG